jgi:FkbM family methyltransferase
VNIYHRIMLQAKRYVKRLPLVTTSYRFLRDHRYLFQAPHNTPLGFKLIGHAGMQEANFEPEVIQLVTTHLKTADVFIDIGANIGLYCCIALLTKKHTIAFEPIPQNLRYLFTNIRSNSWDRNIEIFPIALWDSIGLIEMYGGGTGASAIKHWAQNSVLQKRVVASSTLDIVLADRLEGKRILILIDAEGAEKYILEGARRFLSFRPRPVWIVEITINENLPTGTRVNPNLFAAFDLFWQNGYEAWTADNSGRRVTREDVTAVCETGENTLHTHNFLFLEKDPTPE